MYSAIYPRTLFAARCLITWYVRWSAKKNEKKRNVIKKKRKRGGKEEKKIAKNWELNRKKKTEKYIIIPDFADSIRSLRSSIDYLISARLFPKCPRSFPTITNYNLLLFQQPVKVSRGFLTEDWMKTPIWWWTLLPMLCHHVTHSFAILSVQLRSFLPFLVCCQHGFKISFYRGPK